MTDRMLDVQYTTQLSIPTQNALAHRRNEPNQGCSNDKKARSGWSGIGKSKPGHCRARILWTKVSNRVSNKTGGRNLFLLKPQVSQMLHAPGCQPNPHFAISHGNESRSHHLRPTFSVVQEQSEFDTGTSLTTATVGLCRARLPCSSRITKASAIGQNYRHIYHSHPNGPESLKLFNSFDSHFQMPVARAPPIKQPFEMSTVRRHSTGQRPRIDQQRELHFFAFTNPSIRTVEASANAKIFLETFFNSLHSVRTFRYDRQVEFEHWLRDQQATEIAKEKCRKEWFARESHHLRRSRKLKFRNQIVSLSNQDCKPGGFKILQVLGKGSFGTVCLVQEQLEPLSTSMHLPLTTTESHSRSGTDNMHHTKEFQRGNGSVSAEQLRRPRDSVPGTIYAMKVIRKAEMIKNSQEGHVRAERDFLVASMKSPWVVDLIASFEDNTNLYLVMEYMIGGDFLSLLIKFDTLNEKHTKFYIAEMIMCVEAAHRLRWIHRDVKPDNFLLSSSGHLKIADFGLAFDGHWSHDQNYYHSQRYSILQKLEIPVTGDYYDIELIQSKMLEPGFDDQVYLTPREREATLRHDPSLCDTSGCDSILHWRDKIGRRAFAKSLVGTSQYMAPEVIQGREYDGRCDWWSIGIILYECLFGHTPFNGKDREATKKMIVSHDIYLRLPPQHSTRSYRAPTVYALDLINSLLTRREDRLSSCSYRQNDAFRLYRNPRKPLNGGSTDLCGKFVYPDGAYDIKNHPFFADVPWYNLNRIRPPHIPECKTPADTKYFELFPESFDPQESAESSYESENDAYYTKEFRSYDKTQQLDGPRPRKQSSVSKKKGPYRRSGVDLTTRPRDRILRDELYGRDAMKLRKQHAFLGYTYQRPPQGHLALEEDFDEV